MPRGCRLYDWNGSWGLFCEWADGLIESNFHNECGNQSPKSDWQLQNPSRVFYNPYVLGSIFLHMAGVGSDGVFGTGSTLSIRLWKLRGFGSGDSEPACLSLGSAGLRPKTRVWASCPAGVLLFFSVIQSVGENFSVAICGSCPHLYFLH